jgi:hypothetical protein
MSAHPFGSHAIDKTSAQQTNASVALQLSIDSNPLEPLLASSVADHVTIAYASEGEVRILNLEGEPGL